ncbi:MAG: hypothetical protein HYY37_06180 [Candidatus Aenigmarchaeota archaeon]|nr:hypothetical protein [Candidatus Aenigmarchaeota archaeon]
MTAETRLKESEIAIAQLERNVKLKSMEAGWIGKVFGTAENSANNILGIILVILTLLIVGLVMINRLELIPQLASILSLGIGYLVGKYNR